ncbi:hypothetical protein M427DRAFT_132432 [Gonapodya prolifera JEL478]|uniref:THO complex subunit 1 transcription elongation factor-domain-containing protein n=1 Tax=Gonapodya prolifera (strain JEL478) TaxID=1344416 RepID=A0A139AQZ8_GONPJ|nr:hypothetical protein M427DRAFT_132432 [Gonapodya prolifera JEL478]|eukprot:KXS18925.1 hypothetical protein M427DRAFT_132432 [Gonapodya prolifera JEL478]
MATFPTRPAVFSWESHRARLASSLEAALTDLNGRWLPNHLLHPPARPLQPRTNGTSPASEMGLKDAAVNEAVAAHIAPTHKGFLSTFTTSQEDQAEDLWGKLDQISFRAKATDIISLTGAWSLFDGDDNLNPVHPRTGPSASSMAASNVLGAERRREDLFNRLEDLIDLAQGSADLKHSNESTPMQTIEDIMEMLPLEGCETLFGALEKRRERLCANMLSVKGKGVVFLRTCNELLRRLSRTRNTGFAGRIILMMTTGFPLGERSAVNLAGHYNTDNVTYYALPPDNSIGSLAELLDDGASSDGELDSASEAPGTISVAAMDVDSPRAGTPVPHVNGSQPPGDNRPPVPRMPPTDDAHQFSQSDAERNKRRLYVRFWSLQDLFRNPYSIVESTGTNWEKMKKGIEETLKAFEKAAKASAEDGGTSIVGVSSRDRDKERDRDRDEKDGVRDKPDKDRDDRDRRREEGGGGREGIRESRGGDKDRAKESKKRPRDERIRTEVKEELSLSASGGTYAASSDPGREFFPKFLTGYNLFDLQLHDPLFRRHILVQFLIIIQCLFLSAPDERSRLDAYRASTGKKAPGNEIGMITEKQEQWLDDMRKKVLDALDATGPGAKSFRRTVVTILGHEKNWLKWKTDGCPVYDRPSLILELGPKRKKPRMALTSSLRFDDERDALERNFERPNDPMAQLELDEFSEPLLPELEQLFEERDFLPQRAENNPGWLWKVYRLVSKRYPEIYSSIVAKNNKENSVRRKQASINQKGKKKEEESGKETTVDNAPELDNADTAEMEASLEVETNGVPNGGSVDAGTDNMDVDKIEEGLSDVDSVKALGNRAMDTDAGDHTIGGDGMKHERNEEHVNSKSDLSSINQGQSTVSLAHAGVVARDLSTESLVMSDKPVTLLDPMNPEDLYSTYKRQ